MSSLILLLVLLIVSSLPAAQAMTVGAAAVSSVYSQSSVSLAMQISTTRPVTYAYQFAVYLNSDWITAQPVPSNVTFSVSVSGVMSVTQLVQRNETAPGKPYILNLAPIVPTVPTIPAGAQIAISLQPLRRPAYSPSATASTVTVALLSDTYAVVDQGTQSLPASVAPSNFTAVPSANSLAQGSPVNLTFALSWPYGAPSSAWSSSSALVIRNSGLQGLTGSSAPVCVLSNSTNSRTTPVTLVSSWSNPAKLNGTIIATAASSTLTLSNYDSLVCSKLQIPVSAITSALPTMTISVVGADNGFDTVAYDPAANTRNPLYFFPTADPPLAELQYNPNAFAMRLQLQTGAPYTLNPYAITFTIPGTVLLDNNNRSVAMCQAAATAVGLTGTAISVAPTTLANGSKQIVVQVAATPPLDPWSHPVVSANDILIVTCQGTQAQLPTDGSRFGQVQLVDTSSGLLAVNTTLNAGIRILAVTHGSSVVDSVDSLTFRVATDGRLASGTMLQAVIPIAYLVPSKTSACSDATFAPTPRRVSVDDDNKSAAYTILLVSDAPAGANLTIRCNDIRMTNAATAAPLVNAYAADAVVVTADTPGGDHMQDWFMRPMAQPVATLVLKPATTGTVSGTPLSSTLPKQMTQFLASVTLPNPLRGTSTVGTVGYMDQFWLEFPQSYDMSQAACAMTGGNAVTPITVQGALSANDTGTMLFMPSGQMPAGPYSIRCQNIRNPQAYAFVWSPFNVVVVTVPFDDITSTYVTASGTLSMTAPQAGTASAVSAAAASYSTDLAGSLLQVVFAGAVMLGLAVFA